MLGVKNYTAEYVQACRARIDAQVAAYRHLRAAAEAGGGDADVATAVNAFEPLFFGNLLLALDSLFVHRLRTIEGKDGNPLNEARLICNSLATNGATMLADKSIRLKPDASVLGYAAGDPIRLTEDDFTRLAEGYFAEIHAKYVAA